MAEIALHALTGVVLAGGQGRRMGGIDKGLVDFAGAPLVTHAVGCLRPHVSEVLINANRHLERYAQLSDRVVSDRMLENGQESYQGPLMGIYSGLCAATTEWVVFVPCDSPALPKGLVPRMVAGLAQKVTDGEKVDIAYAFDGERMHPVVAIIRRELRHDLRRALEQGDRKILRWYEQHAWCQVDMSDCPAAFANLNTEEERLALEAAVTGAQP
ncbi:molybdenum cofactor guanylyltransferase MobA [Halomonas binhaiensis]|uniref:molybdenum cofactor guanylyltransferase MobA n=1 Tax=Halomonas binhaiensis TaxID=2562282 RepID=UPI003B8357EB